MYLFCSVLAHRSKERVEACLCSHGVKHCRDSYGLEDCLLSHQILPRPTYQVDRSLGVAAGGDLLGKEPLNSVCYVKISIEEMLWPWRQFKEVILH